MPQALIQRPALCLWHVAARGDGLEKILAGVVEVQDLDQCGRRNLGQRAQTLHPLPNPFGPISDTLYHVRIGCTEEPQIPDQQRPDRLGVPKEHIIERQTQAIGLSLRIEDVDHQQPWLTPRGRKAVASLGRLAAAAPAAGAHHPGIAADADPLTWQGANWGGPGAGGARARGLPPAADG